MWEVERRVSRAGGVGGRHELLAVSGQFRGQPRFQGQWETERGDGRTLAGVLVTEAVCRDNRDPKVFDCLNGEHYKLFRLSVETVCENMALASESGAEDMGGGTDRREDAQQATLEVTPAFDARSIPEFDGSGNVVEWLEQATLLCGLRSVSLMAVLPTRLRGGAFAVWSRMTPATRYNLASVKAKLFKAFALDPFSAHAELVGRRLRPGETADVYLAALQQLAELMGGLPERAIAIFFVNGLPEAARAAVRDGIGETLELENVLDRARSVLSRAAVTETAPTAAAVMAPARQLPSQQSRGPRGGTRPPGPVRCWLCGRLGHIARLCPNGRGGADASAQASPPPPTAPATEHQ